MCFWQVLPGVESTQYFQCKCSMDCRWEGKDFVTSECLNLLTCMLYMEKKKPYENLRK